MVFFKKKKTVAKVPRHEFFHFAENIKTHFSRIRDLQKHTLNKVDSIHESHNKLSHRQNQDVTNMQKWIQYFHNMHYTHNNELKDMKKVILHMDKRFNEVRKIDEQYIKSLVENYVQIPQKDKSEFKKDVIDVLKELRNKQKTNNNVNNVNVVNNDNGVTRYNNGVTNVNQDLNKRIKSYNEDNDNRRYNEQRSYNVNNVVFTKSETKLLGRLFDSTVPLSYMDLARITGHSPNTVKVYINALKKKGVSFDEIDAPNGSKLYAVPNKEKVRKLYNF